MNVKYTLVVFLILALLLPDNDVQCWRRRRRRRTLTSPGIPYDNLEDSRWVTVEKNKRNEQSQSEEEQNESVLYANTMQEEEDAS